MADTPAQNREGEAPVLEVVFERPIADAGRRLRVTRGPDRDPALFESLRPPVLPELLGKQNYYEVRAELISPKHDPVLLAARLRVERGPDSDKGSVVMDTLVEPGTVTLAMAEGASLFVWEIGISRGWTCWTQLRDSLWTLNAAPYRIDNKRVEMKLDRTDDGRLTLKVVEKGSGHHTIYEEVEKDSLRFKAIRQWREPRAQ